MIAGMGRQLVLLDPKNIDWRLDERTRELGRQGIADARKALHEASNRSAA
jgi:hypothetical protein